MNRKCWATVWSLLIVTSLLVFSPSVQAREFYVNGLDGNDSSSGFSRTEAWRTITRANVMAYPGDTVHILEATYYEPIYPRAGSSDESRVVFVAEGNVLLRSQLFAYCASINSYTTLDGFEARGAQYGVAVTGVGAIVRNCRSITNYYGMYISNASRVLIERCVVAKSGYMGIYANIVNSSRFEFCDLLNNAYWGLNIVGSQNAITNSIISKCGFPPYSAVYATPFNYSEYNDYYSNSGGSIGGGIALGSYDIAVDPGFIDVNSEIYHLLPTSLIAAASSKGGAIGAYGIGLLSSNITDSWAGWTDEGGNAIGSPSASIGLDSQGHLRLRDDLLVGAAVTPPIEANIPGGTFKSIDFDAVEMLEFSAGFRQVVDYDTSTRESEIRYRTADTAGALATAPYQIVVRGKPFTAVARYIQVEFTLQRRGN